jgi:hypothetical protein
MKKMMLSAILVLLLVQTVWADLTITSMIVGAEAVVIVRDPARPNKGDDQQVILKFNESKTFQTFGRDVRVYVFHKQTRMQMCSGVGPAQGKLKIEDDGAKWKLK